MAWFVVVLALTGCMREADDTPGSGPAVATQSEPSPLEREVNRDVIPRARQESPRYSFDTGADRKFADFLRDKSDGMVRQAAVGIEREGKLRVQVDRSVSPDDTLPLTKSILAGARKDFAGKAFTLSVYDPGGEPILRARVDGEGGVRYQVVHEGGETSPARGSAGSGSSAAAEPLARSGRSQADRKFADWAEEHGRDYLRYVQADLERNGRLWFGVTRDVKPADVPELTRSLLEGAHKAFPSREIVATVFDPAGERIGRAHLASDGQVRWEH